MPEQTFEQGKSDYCAQRGETVTRAASLSPYVAVVSFEGRGNRLSFIYEPLEVNANTDYKGELVNGVMVINDGAFAPGVLGFDQAMHLAQTMFEPTSNQSPGWYERAKVTRDWPTELRTGHPRKERDRLFEVRALERLVV